MTGHSEDPNADVQYHLGVGPNDVAETALLPGNPDRVETIVDCWDDYEIHSTRREFTTATGQFEETPISVTSTGIGSPSAAIVLEELARIGVTSFIRVGSCGSLRSEVAIGDLVITTGAIRQEGTSEEYIRTDYPAIADYEVICALVAAAERLGYEYHTGITMSADSFYAGQGRPGFDGYEAPGSETLLEELTTANVTNVEMETSSILTLASLYGLRAGSICTVYANRETGEFESADDRRAAETATLAVSLLAAMDKTKRDAGVDHWHAGLSIDD